MIVDRDICLSPSFVPRHARVPSAMSAFGCTLWYAAIDAVLREQPGDSWLTAGEQKVAQRLRSSVRRRGWLSARLLLKRLITSVEEVHRGSTVELAQIEIVSQDSAGRGIRPTAWVGDKALDCRLSIAHTSDHVLVAIAPRDVAVGVDLVDASFRPGAGFRRLWFTAAEQRTLACMPAERAAEMWALKESVYKAINSGTAFRPQQLEVEWPAGPRVYHSNDPKAAACRVATWRTAEGQIAALAALPCKNNWRSVHDD